MKILIVPNLKKKNAKAVCCDTIESLLSLGAKIFMVNELSSEFSKLDVNFYEIDKAFETCDVVLTIGGDGTILHTAKKCLKFNKPILGLNLGRVGFLATAEANEPTKLEKLVNGEYFLDNRSLLKVTCSSKDDFKHHALNDVVIYKKNMTQIMDIDVFCDDILVNRFRADGVVVATPTGSTAYSLSAGGPILDAKIKGITVTPICAHSLHSPPMVFSHERNIKITVFNNANLCCDGSDPEEISFNDNIFVSLSQKYISLICFNEATQFEAIDKKLKGR